MFDICTYKVNLLKVVVYNFAVFKNILKSIEWKKARRR